jgi:hypothetical protein
MWRLRIAVAAAKRKCDLSGDFRRIHFTWRPRAALLPKIRGNRVAEFRIILSEFTATACRSTFAALLLATRRDNAAIVLRPSKLPDGDKLI